MRYNKQIVCFLIVVMLCSLVAGVGCTQRQNEQAKPQVRPIPKIAEPTIKVYLHETGTVQRMKLEDYLQGVVAGEMDNDWPQNALAAQAILARTFTMKIIKTKKGEFPQGADISTDITAAQAFAPDKINARVKKAVAATRGQVVTYQGDYINAWFHAASGGKTATAKEGLGYTKEKTPYITSVKSSEPDVPADDKKWSASFTQDEVVQAIAQQGVKVERVNSLKISKTGPSGRAMEFLVNDQERVSAPNLRVALGSQVFKSTLLTDVQVNGAQIVFKGKGYGHGVGMPQWGAYHLAKSGKSPEEIIQYYFKGVHIERNWD